MLLSERFTKLAIAKLAKRMPLSAVIQILVLDVLFLRLFSRIIFLIVIGNIIMVIRYYIIHLGNLTISGVN